MRDIIRIIVVLTSAIVCLGIVLITDLLLEKLSIERKSLLNKAGVRMVLSYSIGIILFLLIIRVFF